MFIFLHCPSTYLNAEPRPLTQTKQRCCFHSLISISDSAGAKRTWEGVTLTLCQGREGYALKQTVCTAGFCYSGAERVGTGDAIHSRGEGQSTALVPSAPPEPEPEETKGWNVASSWASKQQNKWLRGILRCKRGKYMKGGAVLFINSLVEAVLSHRRHQRSLFSDTQFPKLPPHSSTFLPCSPVPSLFHSVCLLLGIVKGALSLLFICMYCRGLEAERGTVKSLLCVCVCVYLNLVFRWRATLPCFSGQHTLNMNTSREIFILVILCHVCYRLSLAPGNLL